MPWYSAILAIALSAVGCVGTDDPPRELRPIDASAVDGAGSDDDASPGDDAGHDQEVADGGADEDVSSTVCSADRDGVIERSEVPLRAGLSAKFEIAADVEWDTAGTETGDGRVWDLDRDFPGDHIAAVELRDPTGEWFASTFPDATYFTKLTDDSDLLGVFQATEEALLLLGVVSPDEGLYETELEYDPPVQVLSFPISEGDRWTTESDVGGKAQGVVSVYDEDYVSIVDASGTLDTPYGTHDVLRIRVDLERTVGLYTTTTRTYMFVSECFGTVASVRSEESEDDVEFTTAAELRRLSP